jgi:sec-independent protein translocase protein TatB
LFFDLSPLKILVLAVLGLVIFGPEQLPKMAAQAGQALRNLRRLAETARADLSDNLGADFRDFDFNDLNPRAFVRKHLFDEAADESPDHLGGPADARQPDPVDVSVQLGPGEVPPYDLDAT